MEAIDTTIGDGKPRAFNGARHTYLYENRFVRTILPHYVLLLTVMGIDNYNR